MEPGQATALSACLSSPSGSQNNLWDFHFKAELCLKHQDLAAGYKAIQCLDCFIHSVFYCDFNNNTETLISGLNHSYSIHIYRGFSFLTMAFTYYECEEQVGQILSKIDEESLIVRNILHLDFNIQPSRLSRWSSLRRRRLATFTEIKTRKITSWNGSLSSSRNLYRYRTPDFYNYNLDIISRVPFRLTFS